MCCSNVNFEFLADAKCGHLLAFCHAAEIFSLCFLLPCGWAADQPWVLCLAAWLACLPACLQSLLLGKLLKLICIGGLSK
jgi:hypothetical protein